MERSTQLSSLDDEMNRSGRDLPLVRAALRKRRAERAFEDYVREMALRWHLGPDHDGSGADGGPLPRV